MTTIDPFEAAVTAALAAVPHDDPTLAGQALLEAAVRALGEAHDAEAVAATLETTARALRLGAGR
jgi:hypothetical protein